MALSIGTNDSAMRASKQQVLQLGDMEASMERLSTGKRINSASDDAAGVAISSRLSAEIRGTNQSVRNALDAQALLDTAEGRTKKLRTCCNECAKLQCSQQTIPTTLRTA